MRILLASVCLFLVACKTEQKDVTKQLQVSFDHAKVYYEGRVKKDTSLKATEMYWPGTSVSLKFKGTEVSAILEDLKGENYFTVVLDGKQISVLALSQGKKEYVLAENLTDTVHQIELHKRNDWIHGKTLFYAYQYKGDTLFDITKKETFIEFYGDSITVGYGNEDTTGKDRSTGDVTNNYLAYGALTARALNAEYSCIAHSGIGIMVSWDDLIMPEEFDRWNPEDANDSWDFSKKQADIVVVNLFQNDSWLVKRNNHPQFKRRFGVEAPSDEYIIDSYVSFVQKIRSHYPKAKIVCVLGNMDVTKKGSQWPEFVKQAVAKTGDKKMHTLFVSYKDSPGHPKVYEQAAIAEKLIGYLKQI